MSWLFLLRIGRAARAGSVGLAAAVLVMAAGAAPAPWYQWRSLQNGTHVCAQTSPGSGWAQAGGPFRDADCSRPLRVIGL